MLLLVCNPVNFVYYMDAEEINHMESLFKKKKTWLIDWMNYVVVSNGYVFIHIPTEMIQIVEYTNY